MLHELCIDFAVAEDREFGDSTDFLFAVAFKGTRNITGSHSVVDEENAILILPTLQFVLLKFRRVTICLTLIYWKKDLNSTLNEKNTLIRLLCNPLTPKSY